MRKIWFIMAVSSILSSEEFYYEYGKRVDISLVSETRAVNGVSYYKSSTGQKMGLRDEIILKCKSGVECRDSLSKYKFLSIKNLSDSLILVRVRDTKSIFKISQELYNEDNIEFAMPNFIKERRAR